MRTFSHFYRHSKVIARTVAVVVLLMLAGMPTGAAADTTAPVPLLKSGQPVDWWFMFKLNAGTFPGCGGDAQRVCLFGGDVQTKGYTHFGQQFIYASSDNHVLQKGSGCAGDSVNDPLGATFNEVYNGQYHYVVWNDQFYDDPKVSSGGTWGHSKGMLAWDDDGDGLVLQVTTPSWPAAASAAHPRQTDGNTLGCVKDNDVEVSQHFFALKLTKDDVVKVLQALANASVVTDPSVVQVVNSGGPDEISSLVAALGKKVASRTVLKLTLSSDVMLISKPSNLLVPPWQLVSAELGGTDLRTATWWMDPAIYSTTPETKITCWSDDLGQPGAVAIATSGAWDGTAFGLQGGNAPDRNHAKIGVSSSGDAHYTIFGDMNQQGTVSGVGTGKDKCAHSQNQRGGLFFVMDDETLWTGVTDLIKGGTAPTTGP
jgi:hypothetical protein